jgi:transcription antitermination factor NusG
MKWITVQLTSWAEKRSLTKELEKEIKRALKPNPPLAVYYPCIEDVTGKHLTAYTEYIFLEYREGITYQDLENHELFNLVIRDTKGSYRLVEDSDLEEIRVAIAKEDTFEPGQPVKITQGPLKGNEGVVQCEDAEHGQVEIKVYVGEDLKQAVMPKAWVRKKKPRK